MRSSVQTKAKIIYNHFSKAPILEMVQYMVDKNVDAQILHHLKLIDLKMHKNPHVKSYAEKIYDSYERICKILVTYPSLEFKESVINIRKDKEKQFVLEYFNADPKISLNELQSIIKLVNISLTHYIESNNEASHLISNIVTDQKRFEQLTMFLKEASGEDYSRFIKRILAKK